MFNISQDDCFVAVFGGVVGVVATDDDEFAGLRVYIPFHQLQYFLSQDFFFQLDKKVNVSAYI